MFMTFQMWLEFSPWAKYNKRFDFRSSYVGRYGWLQTCTCSCQVPNFATSWWSLVSFHCKWQNYEPGNCIFPGDLCRYLLTVLRNTQDAFYFLRKLVMELHGTFWWNASEKWLFTKLFKQNHSTQLIMYMYRKEFHKQSSSIFLFSNQFVPRN